MRPCSKRYTIHPTSQKFVEQRHKTAVEDLKVNVREWCHLKATGEGTHHRSLEDYSTEMERRFTAKEIAN